MDFDIGHAVFDSDQRCPGQAASGIRAAALAFLASATSPRTLREAKNGIALLNDELARVTSFLARIYSARGRLQAYIDENSNNSIDDVIIPSRRESRIQQMPPEIMAKIFKRCLAGPSTLSAMQFRAVCTKWRDLADSNPRLWASITLPDLLAKNIARDAEMVALWLKRSGGCPLTLDIHCRLDEHPVVEMMLAQSHRWKDVHFIFSAALIQSVATVRNSVPILRSLNLDISVSSSPEVSLDMFEKAPELRRVTLPSKLGHTLRLPWSQVTRCDQHGSLEDYFHVLSQCTNLVSSSLSAYGPPIITPLQPIQHDQLKELHVQQCLDVASLVDNLTLPALNDIMIDPWPYARNIWPQARFLEFLNRSKCNIRKLSLRRICMTESHLIEIIETMPNLEELEVLDAPRVPSVGNKLLRLLTRRELAPKLQVLTLNGAWRFCDTAFVDMVLSRVHSLRTVVACFDRVADSESEDVFRPLLKLKEDGLMDVRLTVKHVPEPTSRRSFDDDY